MIAAHACPAKVAIVAAVTKSGRTCGDDSAVQTLLVEDSLPEKPPASLGLRAAEWKIFVNRTMNA